ncbi:helix-turn-helix domain-containing protein [Nguyenibacter vanlangensis]|uniref:helix-turn-helix domain-containing protein n=1 Tax=Nguyenibacter vanlangensis TaxID=1216886 RepID=UPI0038D0B02C
MLEPLVYRTKECCDLLRIKPTTFWKLVKEGKLEARKLGGVTVVPAGSLKRFAENLPPAASPWAAYRAAPSVEVPTSWQAPS